MTPKDSFRPPFKDQAHVLNMEPVNTTVIYEPTWVIDTDIKDSMTMFGNITNSNNTILTSSINMANIGRK